MQPRKLQCCIWRDSIKASFLFAWFCVFFVSKGNPFWLLFHTWRLFCHCLFLISPFGVSQRLFFLIEEVLHLNVFYIIPMLQIVDSSELYDGVSYLVIKQLTLSANFRVQLVNINKSLWKQMTKSMEKRVLLSYANNKGSAQYALLPSLIRIITVLLYIIYYTLNLHSGNEGLDRSELGFHLVYMQESELSVLSKRRLWSY